MNNLLKKVELYGEKSLSDLEILFILFGKRNVKKIMVLYENVFNDYGKYSNMYELTTNELVNTYGFSNNESLKFRVICEFAKRFNKTLNLEKRIIKSSKDINPFSTVSINNDYSFLIVPISKFDSNKGYYIVGPFKQTTCKEENNYNLYCINNRCIKYLYNLLTDSRFRRALDCRHKPFHWV